ncbi:Os12g0132850, partial [Oryza sativa Japonica Group]
MRNHDRSYMMHQEIQHRIQYLPLSEQHANYDKHQTKLTLHVYVCSIHTGGEGGDGNEEELPVGNALVLLLPLLHGAAGAAIVVHLGRRRLSHQRRR